MGLQWYLSPRVATIALAILNLSLFSMHPGMCHQNPQVEQGQRKPQWLTQTPDFY